MNCTPSAFSEALALESIPESLYSVNQDDLVDYARTVAYKVFHNLKNNHEMDKSEDPLKVGNKPANEVWQHHYEKA